jgi:hypothetical protein
MFLVRIRNFPLLFQLYSLGVRISCLPGRSDGEEVVVDNKFMRDNYPILVLPYTSFLIMSWC